MPIDNLPSAGSDFRANRFARKLSSLARAGSFKNLKDNTDSISKAVSSYSTSIKRGGLSRKQQISVLKKVKQMEGSRFTKVDKMETQQILKHLSQKYAAQSRKSVGVAVVDKKGKSASNQLSKMDLKKSR